MPPFNMNGAGNNSNSAPQFQPNPGYGNGPQQQIPQTMTFMESVQTCFNKYADFNGRASRAECWWWILFCVIVGAVCSAISEWLGGIANLALLVPSLAVYWRRLHDTGRAGGWFFIAFIPLVGWIFLIVWLATRGQDTPNRFGNVPVK